MVGAVKIGIIGDYDPAKISHRATIEALQHAARKLSLDPEITWIPTKSLINEAGQEKLSGFDCYFASPGAPYDSMTGALNGIRFARESGKPFTGN